MTRVRTLRAALIVTGASACAVPLAAQGVRISGTSTVQSIDLRPLRRDSLAARLLPGDGLLRTGPDGDLLECPAGSAWCYRLVAGTRATAAPMLQDVALAAWGLGEGVSAHAHVRARTRLGGDAALWPRLGDRFDALDAYVQVDRAAGQLRLGRLWTANALGAYGYDGGALLLRRGRHALEVYGGRALVQGLNEPYPSAELGAVDDLPPEAHGVMVGVRVRARPTASSSVAGLYQRVIVQDRSGLHAERAALDGTLRAGRVTLDGALAYDVAGRLVNEARLRAGRRLGTRVDAALEARRHRPFFELWTIWGAFAPVGFDEARGDLTWRVRPALHLTARGGVRRYDETNAGLQALPLRGDGWRAGVDALWLPDPRLTASVHYAVDLGPGAARSDASASARWTLPRGLDLGAHLSTFQSIYEFRVGTGRVAGAMLDAGYRLTATWRLAADAALYRHARTGGTPAADWSQRRAAVRLEWVLGHDPGGSS